MRDNLRSSGHEVPAKEFVELGRPTGQSAVELFANVRRLPDKLLPDLLVGQLLLDPGVEGHRIILGWEAGGPHRLGQLRAQAGEGAGGSRVGDEIAAFGGVGLEVIEFRQMPVG